MSEHILLSLERCLTRLQTGDAAARWELIQHACKHLLRLTRKMMADFPGLRRWEESDDVMPSALLRLARALEAVTPQSTRQFFRLAALQIRRELLDLARHYQGPEGPGANKAPSSASGQPDSADLTAPSSLDPAHLAEWTELHERIAQLPEAEREVVELLWYQGLTQVEAAAVLGVSDRTVKRYWQSARMRLQQAFFGLPAKDEQRDRKSG